ncbi:MAG: pallilysin-related adhesin [Treponema sp.]|jgi:hypothetical protein|nr:pallilysin-related adhesin [Treponema sp.]
MIRNILKLTVVILTGAIAVGLGFLITHPQERLFSRKNEEPQRQRIVISRDLEAGDSGFDSPAERMAYEDSVSTKIALGDGEVMLAVLTQDFDGDPVEEQIIAYRNLAERDGPIHIAYVDYDEGRRLYGRVWDAPTAVTRPGTLSLAVQDLIGDRSVCIVVTGMDHEGAHTLTVFRRPPPAGNPRPPSPAGDQAPAAGEVFKKIAELRIDGSIQIREIERPQSYQSGISRAASFPIATYGHDPASENILDQVEIIYTYDPAAERYEPSTTTRIPGSQIEQRRLRELLSGTPGVFEDFIHDLWYFVGPQGTLDSRQYIYFDPPSREIIFFGDGAQQAFVWQNSSPTRYGLYVASQNILVTTMRRTIDIELESMDSIRVKVFEDVRLKIRADNTWDGSYRRAGSAKKADPVSVSQFPPYISAQYEGSLGRIRFSPDGNFEIRSGEQVRRGHYAFFRIEGREALEFRTMASPSSARTPSPENPGSSESAGQDSSRTTYLVERSGDNLILSRIRIGAMGIRDLHENSITLTLLNQSQN